MIADSLGGVANAYNITPQNSTLNRHGEQAYMEKTIRNAGGCTDFIAIITYPNTETQIPNHYSFTYTIEGNVITDEFDNIDPDEENNEVVEKIVEVAQEDKILQIRDVNKQTEEVTIMNSSNRTINLKGFMLVSVKGNQSYTFIDYELAPGETVIVYGKGGSGDLEGWINNVWSNSDSDPAELYSADGELIDRWDD